MLLERLIQPSQIGEGLGRGRHTAVFQVSEIAGRPLGGGSQQILHPVTGLLALATGRTSSRRPRNLPAVSGIAPSRRPAHHRSEEHTSELQSPVVISYA